MRSMLMGMFHHHQLFRSRWTNTMDQSGLSEKIWNSVKNFLFMEYLGLFLGNI